MTTWQPIRHNERHGLGWRCSLAVRVQTRDRQGWKRGLYAEFTVGRLVAKWLGVDAGGTIGFSVSDEYPGCYLAAAGTGKYKLRLKCPGRSKAYTVNAGASKISSVPFPARPLAVEGFLDGPTRAVLLREYDPEEDA